MGRHRDITLAIRKAIDDYAINHLTMAVKSTSVFQGVIDGEITHASVQESGSVLRQPKLEDEQAHLIRSLREFEPTIYEAHEGCAYCSGCGEWRLKSRFSPDKRKKNGLQTYCKQCRAEQERKA